MDIWSKQKRSEVMGKIRGKNTRPEKILRSELFKLGYRFRVHKKDLPGKPDIVLSKYKTVIFVNGCFWHFHKNCHDGHIPSSNIDYWKEKIENNIRRDLNNNKKLKKDGWKVLNLWECEIEKNIGKVIVRIIKKIN